ncbi:hypothetical protein B0H10DRAFT_2041115 [Mycena sp. CBHHK59/15]|nr:hypothetical protein B0H10DRAFT_2041115 [Mycena sp. CBHHK59/15]
MAKSRRNTSQRRARPAVAHNPTDEQGMICDLVESLECAALMLPPEITSEIFINCLPHPNAIYPGLNTAPIVLTRICRAWRDVALSTPRLWESIQMVFGNRRDEKPAKDIALLETWFSRAGNHPLDINLTSHNDVTKRTVTQWDKMLPDLFERYSHQWRRLPRFGAITPFLPQLQELRIRVHDAAPRANQLTNVDAAVASIDQCLRLLRETPAITDCMLQSLQPSGRDVVPPILSLTFMRSLCLAGKSLDILSHITLPALQILNLQSIYAMQLLNSLSSLKNLTILRPLAENLMPIFASLSRISFLPRLERLVCYGPDELPQEFYDHLVDGLSQLTHFKLEAKHPLPEGPTREEFVRRLKALLTEGMEVCIENGEWGWSWV